MAEETIQVEIVTPERAVFSDVATQVVIPGTIGELGVLPGHLPLLTSIAMGDLAVYTGGQIRHFFVEGGYAEILPHKVSILTENCDGVDEIDIAEAQRQLEQAEKEMSALEDKARSETIEADIRARHQDALERARRRAVFAQDVKSAKKD